MLQKLACGMGMGESGYEARQLAAMPHSTFAEVSYGALTGSSAVDEKSTIALVDEHQRRPDLDHRTHGGSSMTIPRTMKAAVVEKFREPLVMRELPVPTPWPGQALVEIMASGVCHTDLHAADGDWPVKPNLPLTPGHEGTGVVVALGSGVKHFKEGDGVGGCIARAVIVTFAYQAGKPYVWNRRTLAIR